MNSSPSRLLLPLLLVCALPPAQGTPVHWTLAPTTIHSAIFHPDQTTLVSGHFIYDAHSNVYSQWNLHISGVPAPHDTLNGEITPSDSRIIEAFPNALVLNYSPAANLLFLHFASFSVSGEPALSDAGGTVNGSIQISTIIPSFGSFTVNGSLTVHGEPPDNLVPEPAAGVLVLLGAIALCFRKRR